MQKGLASQAPGCRKIGRIRGAWLARCNGERAWRAWAGSGRAPATIRVTAPFAAKHRDCRLFLLLRLSPSSPFLNLHPHRRLRLCSGTRKTPFDPVIADLSAASRIASGSAASTPPPAPSAAATSAAWRQLLLLQTVLPLTVAALAFVLLAHSFTVQSLPSSTNSTPQQLHPKSQYKTKFERHKLQMAEARRRAVFEAESWVLVCRRRLEELEESMRTEGERMKAAAQELDNLGRVRIGNARRASGARIERKRC